MVCAVVVMVLWRERGGWESRREGEGENRREIDLMCNFYEFMHVEFKECSSW